jgi:hypothetical protein
LTLLISELVNKEIENKHKYSQCVCAERENKKETKKKTEKMRI